MIGICPIRSCFNTQPPEGGWRAVFRFYALHIMVSTHSRPKAAGNADGSKRRYEFVSTHSRPKAAGASVVQGRNQIQCFNTQPPEGGWLSAMAQPTLLQWFQHTAARRRLVER